MSDWFRWLMEAESKPLSPVARRVISSAIGPACTWIDAGGLTFPSPPSEAAIVVKKGRFGPFVIANQVTMAVVGAHADDIAEIAFVTKESDEMYLEGITLLMRCNGAAVRLVKESCWGDVTAQSPDIDIKADLTPDQAKWIIDWARWVFGVVFLVQAASTKVVDAPLPRSLRRQALRAGLRQPACRRVRIVIDGIRRGGESRGGHRDLPLHGVRGHWKDFRRTGLFGDSRRAGWFFVPDHMRGDGDNGTNWHEYRIKGD